MTNPLERLPSLLAAITCDGYNFETRLDGSHHELRVWAIRPMNTPLKGRQGGYAERQNGRWWRLSHWMTDGEIAQTALMACLAFEEHEIRERFLYKGVSVFDPHYDLDALVALRLAPNGGGLKEREAPKDAQDRLSCGKCHRSDCPECFPRAAPMDLPQESSL